VSRASEPSGGDVAAAAALLGFAVEVDRREKVAAALAHLQRGLAALDELALDDEPPSAAFDPRWR
jgi:hypothetical protein